MDIVCENFLNEKLADNNRVFAVTLVKLLLNKKKIDSFYSKVEGATGSYGPVVTDDNTDCKQCKLIKERENSEDHVCRTHRSVFRVLNPDDNIVLHDTFTGYYFTKNEIYKPTTDGQAVVISCPHTKLIRGQVTDQKVRLVHLFVIGNYGEKAADREVIDFSTEELFNNKVQCWFNRAFTLSTEPKENGYFNWYLIPNKIHQTIQK